MHRQLLPACPRVEHEDVGGRHVELAALLAVGLAMGLADEARHGEAAAAALAGGVALVSVVVRRTVSLVLVSPSTVMQLNELSAADRSAC